MPAYQHLGRYRLVAATQHGDQAENPAGQHIDDLEQYRPANHHRVQPADDRAGQPPNRVFERYMFREGTMQQSCRG
jgi:hypothetical protein